MKQVATLLVLAIITLVSTTASAQYYFYNDKYYEDNLTFEIGGSGSLMNCLTDLGGRKGLGKGFIKDINPKNTQLGGGIYVTALYKHIIGLRLEGFVGKVKAYDSVLKNDNGAGKNRYERNLNFQTTLSEFSALLEFHPLFLKNYDMAEEELPRLSPYIVAGIGFFNYKPQGTINGRLVDLEPLRTEGQGFNEYPSRKRYNLTQINVPVGIGVKYELGALLNVRAEVVHRILFTDYLDDVSTKYIDPSTYATNLSASTAWYNQTRSATPSNYSTGSIRGNSKNNDAYFSFNLKVGLVLGRTRVR